MNQKNLLKQAQKSKDYIHKRKVTQDMNIQYLPFAATEMRRE